MKENQTGQKTVQLKRKFPFDHTKQSLSQCFIWWGILIATALGVITSRYSQICSLLRKTKKDLVAKQHITVVFNETDGDHKATTSRCFFLLLEIKAQKITLEVIQLSHSSQLWWALYNFFQLCWWWSCSWLLDSDSTAQLNTLWSLNM